MKKVVAIILAVLMLFALCACGSKGGGNKAGRPTTYDGKNEYEALLNYANRLEEAGNAEAAALVRSKIPQAGRGEIRIWDRVLYKGNLHPPEYGFYRGY